MQIVEDLQQKLRSVSHQMETFLHSLRLVITNLKKIFMASEQEFQKCLLHGKLMVLEETVISIKILVVLLSLMIIQNIWVEVINIYKIFDLIKNWIVSCLKILQNLLKNKIKSKKKIF